MFTMSLQAQGSMLHVRGTLPVTRAICLPSMNQPLQVSGEILQLLDCQQV